MLLYVNVYVWVRESVCVTHLSSATGWNVEPPPVGAVIGWRLFFFFSFDGAQKYATHIVVKCLWSVGKWVSVPVCECVLFFMAAMLLLFAAFGMPQKLCTNRCHHFANLCYGPRSLRLDQSDCLPISLSRCPVGLSVWWQGAGDSFWHFGKQLKTCFNQSHLANNFLNALANAMATIYGDSEWKFKIHVSKINNRRMLQLTVSMCVCLCALVCINTICPLSSNNWMRWLLPNWFSTAPPDSSTGNGKSSSRRRQKANKCGRCAVCELLQSANISLCIVYSIAWVSMCVCVCVWERVACARLRRLLSLGLGQYKWHIKYTLSGTCDSSTNWMQLKGRYLYNAYVSNCILLARWST